MDYVEESHTLSLPECNLRTLIVSILSRVTQAKLKLWKQWSKVRAALEGDENTRYFHACANQCHCRNKIQIIEHNNCELHNHDQKTAVLCSFYLNLLGCARATNWSFQLQDLYPEGALSLNCLVAPFDSAKIHRDYRHMHSTASPGPDGFGSLFFKATLSTTSPEIFALFDAFHSHLPILNV